MDLKENIRMLFCLNEQGEAKANEILKELLQNPEFISITNEQLTEELNEEEIQLENEYKQLEKDLEENYKEVLQILSKQVPSFDNIELLEAIQSKYGAGKLGIISLFNYGVFEGKRVERARRKKLN